MVRKVEEAALRSVNGGQMGAVALCSDPSEPHESQINTGLLSNYPHCTSTQSLMHRLHRRILMEEQQEVSWSVSLNRASAREKKEIDAGSCSSRTPLVLPDIEEKGLGFSKKRIAT